MKARYTTARDDNEENTTMLVFRTHKWMKEKEKNMDTKTNEKTITDTK